ncbi:response regulator [Noviherbaspirillum sp. ST9]|uniref:hybrid sensor histidine kinase/response regulator n=1 Tax=Noviherbaspirillum sp. ST9 TaxID=3401606 RepID=UPI003B588F4C
MDTNDAINILLVDDDPAQLLALNAVLETLGQTCVRANSGSEALKHVLRTDFAVILLDVRMPDISGFDTARLIRDHPRASHVPIIFVTAADDDAFPVEKAYSLGAVDYLTKPVIPAVLRAKVAFFVDLHRKTRELARIERERHAAALSAKDERIRLILGNTKEYAFIVTDAHGRITEWEGGAERITGWSPEQAVGRSTELIYTADDRAVGCPQDEMEQAMHAGRAEGKRWYVRKDGSRFFADGVTIALKDPAGELRGYAMIFHDATNERLAADALMASERRLRLSTEAAELGLWVWDSASDRVTWENARLIEIFGFSKEDAPADMAGFMSGFLHPEDAPALQQAIAHTMDGGDRLRFQGRFFRRPGHELRWIDMTGLLQLSTDGESPRILGTAADITDRKRAEEALRRLAEDLSTADRRKTEFLAILAHELRNPLAPIRSGLELIRLAGDNAETVSRVREMMDRQLGHLVHLVDDLLDIARIAGNKLELKIQRVELKSMVNSAVETSQPLIEGGGHAFSIDLPDEDLYLDVDPIRIAQVIGNLLNNAAKYTPPGGSIGLAATRAGDEAVIDVFDTGIGIPADAIAEVFDMFTQVERSTHAVHGGLGIGLSLVRRLVEQHGGSVSAASPGPGRGSTFTVRLPLAVDGSGHDAAPAGDALSGTSPQSRSLRVLVADDNLDAADTLAALLEQSGHSVRLAGDGAQALELAREFHPDIAFLDIGMPGMSGYEVARAFRHLPGGAAVVLVAVTGWGTEEDRARSRAAGFNLHLTKPVSMTEIDRLLASTMTALATT